MGAQRKELRVVLNVSCIARRGYLMPVHTWLALATLSPLYGEEMVENMAEDHDIRWKQRFVHYRKAFTLLEQAVSIPRLSEVERAGLIHFFEMTYELAWKVMKDYLEQEGFQVASPREAVKIAFQSGLISDGQVWLEALQDRNLAVHTYEENIALAVEKRIRDSYFPLLAGLLHRLAEKAEN